jgi:hypothetical protein
MFRKALVSVGLVLLTLLPAQATISIDSVIGQIFPDKISFDINLHNMDDVPLMGPVLIHLQSRVSPSVPWQDVQVWDVEAIRAGRSWREEFESEDEAQKAKANKTYEARLWVECTGLPKTEKMARLFVAK